MLQVVFLLLSQEQHGSDCKGPELPPHTPPSQKAARRTGAWREGGGLTLAFGWKATQEMGVRSKLKESFSLSHHLNEGHQLSQLFQIAGPVPLGKPGWSVTLYRPFPPTHNCPLFEKTF